MSQDVIVFIVCDTGERYLSKVHNQDWLKLNRMLDTEIRTLRDISDVKKAKGIEEITSVKETDKVKDVLELITKTGYSQIPVLSGKKSIGSVKESKLFYEKNRFFSTDRWVRCHPILTFEGGKTGHLGKTGNIQYIVGRQNSFEGAANL